MRRRTWEANLITGFVLSLVLAGLILAVRYGWGRWSEPVMILLVLAAIAAAACVLGLLFGAFDMLVAQHQIERARVAAARNRATPEIQLLMAQTELVTRLEMAPEYVIDVLRNDSAIARVIAGNFGPVAGVATKDGQVPYEFIDEWYAYNAKRDALLPVSQWPTAGNRQRYASWLERHLIAAGILQTWAGSNTAEWASPHAKEEFVKQFYGQRVNRRRVVRVDDDGEAE